MNAPRHEMPTLGPAIELAGKFAANIPVLTSEHVRLRAPQLSDFEGFAEIFCSDRSAFIDGPYSREQAWGEFHGLMSCWMIYGHGGWAVEEIATGKLAGFVMLGLEPGDEEVELGFLFRAWAEGRGFAFEAAELARDFAWDVLKFSTLVSYVDESNVRSVALAQRLGGFDDTPPEFHEADTCVFRHLPKGARS
ncbi:MAG: GNAT family N-acetyltransferase [Boseongicola sp.]|nr:MAG: GNAT family N-acetyltransferase [Boseongicola sp.]